MWKMHRFYAAPARSEARFAGESAAGRRIEPRKPVYNVDALIFSKDLSSPQRCTIRDQSKSGARLELTRGMKTSASPAYIPERLVLYFCPDKTEVDCRLAWRDGRHFGVKFTSAVRRARGRSV
jgi:hypothetical protein